MRSSWPLAVRASVSWRQPEMARIVHLANFFGPRSGGLRTTMLQLAAQYEGFGHQVHLVVPAARDAHRQVNGVHIHELSAVQIPGSGGYRVIHRLNTVRHILATIEPQAIELSDRTTLLPIASWGRARNIPVTCIVHERVDGVLAAHTPWLPGPRIADICNRSLARRVDQIVATTQFAATEFERIGVPVLRVPLGVDTDTFHPTHVSGAWHSRLGVQVVMVMTSRLSKEKEPGFAIEVLRTCVHMGLDAHLLVVGDGPQRSRLQAQANGLPVTFLGFVSDRAQLAAILAEADVALAPGPIETFGLAALEAMASGTPVIAHADSALGEVIGDSGGVALPPDAACWARAVTHLAEDPLAGLRARDRACAFTWPNTARLMLAASGLTSTTDAVLR